MTSKTEPNISWLFDTSALKIAPADSPFWYTSGLIGAYYINTQFLCGGPAKAQEILQLIDENQEDHAIFHQTMVEALTAVYDEHEIYRHVIDLMLNAIRTEFPIDQIDYISGGQRRDWFFAPLIADKLSIPALYVYNDLHIYDKAGDLVDDLKDEKVLNCADLLTVGSSYTKKWIPAIAQKGGRLCWSINGVDRLQNGVTNLTEAGIEKVHSLFAIDQTLFDQALQRGYIDRDQYELVKGYLADPFTSMRQFIIDHPEFLEAAQNSTDEKTLKRVKMLIEEDLYKLNQ